MSAFEPSPADVVRYDHVIRLTQYRYAAGSPSPQEISDFIAALAMRGSLPLSAAL